MSITNFTPGPWRLTGGNLPQWHVLQDRDGSSLAEVRGKGERDHAANARLMALAPELYTVLDAFLSDYEERGEVDYKLRQRAQAVLDKAVGR